MLKKINMFNTLFTIFAMAFLCCCFTKTAYAKTDLRKCKVVSYKRYYTYTGNPNIPSTITIQTPVLKVKKTLKKDRDYTFFDWEEKDISKTGGDIILRGKGSYDFFMKIRIDVLNGTMKVSSYQNASVSKKNFKNGKCVVQLKKPVIKGVSAYSADGMKYKFRLKYGNPKIISVSSSGSVTIRSTKKAIYEAECTITAYKYNPCKRSLKIIVN